MIHVSDTLPDTQSETRTRGNVDGFGADCTYVGEVADFEDERWDESHGGVGRDVMRLVPGYFIRARSLSLYDRLDVSRVPSCRVTMYSPWKCGSMCAIRCAFTSSERWMRMK